MRLSVIRAKRAYESMVHDYGASAQETRKAKKALRAARVARRARLRGLD